VVSEVIGTFASVLYLDFNTINGAANWNIISGESEIG